MLSRHILMRESFLKPTNNRGHKQLFRGGGQEEFVFVGNNRGRFWPFGRQWAKGHFLNFLGPSVCKPGIQFVDQGDSATITCNATNVPREYMTCITQGPGNSQEIANCSHVTVQDVSVSDGGYYSCVSTANINETDMASCYLQVICMLLFILIIILLLHLPIRPAQNFSK